MQKCLADTVYDRLSSIHICIWKPLKNNVNIVNVAKKDKKLSSYTNHVPAMKNTFPFGQINTPTGFWKKCSLKTMATATQHGATTTQHTLTMSKKIEIATTKLRLTTCKHNVNKFLSCKRRYVVYIANHQLCLC